MYGIFGVLIFWVKNYCSLNLFIYFRHILYAEDDFLVLGVKKQVNYFLNCNFLFFLKTFFDIFGVYIFWGKLKVIRTGSCEEGERSIWLLSQNALYRLTLSNSVKQIYKHTNIQFKVFVNICIHYEKSDFFITCVFFSHRGGAGAGGITYSMSLFY